MHTQPRTSTDSHQPLISNLTHNLLWILTAGLMLLALGLASPAQAQSTVPPFAQADSSAPYVEEDAPRSRPLTVRSATWRSHFDEQAAQVLRETDATSARTTVLRDVIIIAAHASDAIDLTSTVHALVDVCEHNTDEQRRLMAIQALHEIGTDQASTPVYREALQRLHRIAQTDPSERVRRAAAEVLHAFFGST